MAMIELTISELSLVAGGDAGFSVTLDDAGTTTGTFTGFSQPTTSSISFTVDATGDVNGNFEATFAAFANNGLPED
jgi:hypothetical protein